ncbi:hypothetical protein [Ferviditalea candida]|uniref:Uncharacterized protein n=1 Tax=Ferviditalea candida TaxID=3108399 RepID=A0ABU5ZMA3_9BACL|nr:hypothetical protein [Paenibacillaceae bacterium T2]
MKNISNRHAQISQTGNFTYLTRTQFTFYASDSILNSVLGGIAGKRVSIAGYMQTKIGKTNLVRLVVGPQGAVSISDTATARNVLKSLGVRLRMKKVLQVLGIVAGTPGIIRSIYRSLYHKVTVYAIYLGENSNIFVDTCNPSRTIQILKRNNLI